MARLYIALGSNIDPEANILAALRLLAERLRVVGMSTLYRTPPLGRPEQPDFINGMVAVETELGVTAVKQLLREIEQRLGRVRTEDTYAARTIDLDLVDRADPEVLERPFLLVPLAELVAQAASAELAPLTELTAQARREVLR